MKVSAISLLAALCLPFAACRTLPVEGEAVQCDACATMWIYLASTTSAPGLYRMKEETRGRRVCPDCQRLAVRYFETGVLPRQCPQCESPLRVRGVDIIK